MSAALDLHHRRHAAPAPAPAAASADLADLRRRIAKLERLAWTHLPDEIGRLVADLQRKIDKVADAEAIRNKVGEALAEAYQGVWDVSRSFSKGTLVTSDGSLWLSLVASKGLRPGSNNGAWRLVAKGYTTSARKKETAK